MQAQHPEPEPLLHIRREAPGATTALHGKKPEGQSIVSPAPKRQRSEQTTQARISSGDPAEV